MTSTTIHLADPRAQAALLAALARLRSAVAQVADRLVESLGNSALAAPNIRQRDLYMGAQFELRRKLAAFNLAFADTLAQKVHKELLPRDAPGRAVATDWQSLTLVDDKQVEEMVSADRFAQAILTDCEWELRELDGYMSGVLRLGRSEKDRNPLRPEVVGKALLRAIEAGSDDNESRRVIGRELGHMLGPAIRTCYSEISADLRARGFLPAGLALKTVEGPGIEYLRHFGPEGRQGPASSFDETLGLPGESSPMSFSHSQSGPASGYPSGFQHSGFHHSGASGQPGSSFAGGPGSGYHEGDAPGRGTRPGHSSHGVHTGTTRSGASTVSPSGPGGGPGRYSPEYYRRGTPIGNVDAQMMALLRKLAYLGNLPGEFRRSSSPGAFDEALHANPTANLIRTHREELRAASTGALDHMVIDVVGSLFDQILSDPKVPPQMARQIARLQLPVLRVALGDVTFFSSRRHPVRRFVNRIASLACAFDDFDEGPGAHFLQQVRDLVQEIVTGDFDQMELYEGKLAELENFIASQVKEEVEAAGRGDTPALLDIKEDELRLQQRYMQQLHAALAPVLLPEFMREFLTQVWSQAIVHAARKRADDPTVLARMRRAARELVMSIQPKGAPAQRKNFLLALPQMMRDLNEGLAMIGWSETAKKDFFGKLLPAHAESLKGGEMSQLDHNLLVRQLDSIFGAPLPQPEELRRHDVVPVLEDVVYERQFTPEEAEQIGLVDERAVDWDGKVDIEVGAEPELTEVDINIDGLPPVEPPDPTRGPDLIDHIQLGFAYQMHLNDQWQKVRLSYVSPGRAFFVFTRGRKHQQTISMTARMVKRMCETGRLRAFENAYLIERATARARKQLAALGVSTSSKETTTH